METLVITSKIKKFIKAQGDMNTSAQVADVLTQKIAKTLDDAINSAKTNGRKTVMGRDLNYYKEDPKVEEVLVVASKIKKYIKDKSELSTSSQCFEQLTLQVEMWCKEAMEKAKADKRKTVMERDLQ